MTYNDFRINTLKANTKKTFKIRNSYGARDAYRWSVKYKKIKISESDFREIINTLNKTLQDQLLQGKDIILPNRLGRIEIRKYKTYVGLEGGKLKTNLSVDWKNTLKLWHEDEESYHNKSLVRHETPEKFKILYNKSKAKYCNKVFYSFSPTRDLKLKLKEIINNKGFDALLLWDKNGLYKHKCNS